MTDQHLLDDLLELERAGWRSRCESTGDRFYGDLMTDDALMVLATGDRWRLVLYQQTALTR